MRNLLTLLAPLSFSLCAALASSANAAEYATAAEAQAMVKKAVNYFQTYGRQKALEEFNNAKGPFVDRDLYVFVLDANGMTLANGNNNKIVGKNVLHMTDADGKNFIREILQIGNSKGQGWVEYKWPDPVSKNVRQKSTYVEKSGELYFGAGIYK